MFKFIANTYKEIYAWFLFNTSNSFVSFGLSYLILIALQLLNVYSGLLIVQKVLGIQLLAFIWTQHVYVAVFILAILAINFFFMGRMWKRNEEIKDATNRALAYIIISVVAGAVAYIYGHNVSS